MGTTKLTRKEILAEDPVHGAIIRLIECFGKTAKRSASAVIVVLVAMGMTAGFNISIAKGKAKAQETLGKGIDFFHAPVAADAMDDPYGKGSSPTFRSDLAKYKAAAKEFSSIIDRRGFGKISVARAMLPGPLPASDWE